MSVVLHFIFHFILPRFWEIVKDFFIFAIYYLILFAFAFAQKRFPLDKSGKMCYNTNTNVSHKPPDNESASFYRCQGVLYGDACIE